MLKLVLLVLVGVSTCVGSAQSPAHTTKAAPATPTPAPTMDPETAEKIKNLERTVDTIGRQLMNQQTYVEERIRSDGNSGIKSLRHIHEGTREYFGDTHVGGSALGMHDHADYDRTIGLGEFIAVMNGVEFRTRHNDYKFRRPAHNRTYEAYEDIPFPNVPSSVTNKPTLDAQIEEMRLYFKAFKTQNESLRNYKPHFRANLCYLEGAWTLNAKTLSEPFQSDRHHIDASSWFDLQEKIRYTSYAGSKSNLENFAYLPTTMYNITDGIPQLAQWNYRIMCHPLKQDVPLAYFQLQDDLGNRLAHKLTWDKVLDNRVARFKINEFGTDRFYHYSFMDKLMSEIPGKDNYGANLTDDSFGALNYAVDPTKPDQVLNTGMYHRWFKLGQKGAMGLTVNHRGYHDENMWVAQTSQPNVMPLTISKCTHGGRDCRWETKRVSYAIPLEIVYSTPLSNWNPYNLVVGEDKYVIANHRSGQNNKEHAYNGTSYKRYYRTPPEFYKSTSVQRDPADTARGSVHVLDKEGNIRAVAPAGFRMVTPDIEGVGKVRTRYPIFPVHSEGSTVGAELMALKDMVMKMGRYQYLYQETPMGQAMPPEEDKKFHLHDSNRNPPGLHGHDFSLTPAEYEQLMNGTDISVTTSYNLGHQHQLVIFYDDRYKTYRYRTCDTLLNCWDRHSHALEFLSH